MSTRIDIIERIMEAMGPRFIYVGARQWEELRGDKEFFNGVSFEVNGEAFYRFSKIMKLEIIVVEKDDHINVA